MKLVYAIIQNDDERDLLNELNKRGFTATRLATSGGFLRKANTMLMVGTEPEKVETVKAIIRAMCGKRKRITISPTEGYGGLSYPFEVDTGGATIFVIDVDDYEKV